MKKCIEVADIDKSVKAKPLSRSNQYVLLEDFSIKQGWLLIPAKYKWDGASIPRVFWTLVGSPYSPKFMRASLVHDFLYYRTDVSAKCNDKVFYSVLREDGVSTIKAKIMYYAVRSYRVFK